jgi:opacity protein-like surface antigen
MKQVLFIIFALTLFSLGSYAQRFEGGILGGLNGTQVDGDSYKGYHKAGLVLGAYAQTDLSRNLFAAMEMKFAQKGSRNIDSTAAYGQIKYIMRLNYAELPVYLGIRTTDKTSIIVGASFGYLISGKEFNDYGEFPPEDQHPFNAFDLEAMLGFRFQITDRLFVDVRGAYSVIPIRQKIDDADLYYWRDNQFNNVLNTTVLYRIDF